MSEVLSPFELTKEAKSAYQKKDFATAARLYEAARQGYLSENNPLMTAEIANNLSVSLLQGGENMAALQAVEGTEEIFRQARDFKREAIALGNLAAALEALNRLDEAEQRYWQAANIFKELGENELRLPLMQSISRIQLRSGRQLQAVASMYSGIENIKSPTRTQKLLKRLLEIPIQLINSQSNKLPDDTNNNKR